MNAANDLACHSRVRLLVGKAGRQLQNDKATYVGVSQHGAESLWFIRQLGSSETWKRSLRPINDWL